MEQGEPVPADSSSPQNPFVSPRAVIVTALWPPPTPLGNLQLHLPPQTRITSSCRVNRHRWDGGSCSAGAARLLGGTSVGDTPTVPECPCPLHLPSTPVTASTELPKSPGTPSLGTCWGHSTGQRTVPVLSPGAAEPKVWGHRAKVWVPRAAAVMGTQQWPCCPSGAPTKALPLGRHGSTGALPAQGCTHLGTRWLPPPGATGCEVAEGQRRCPPWDAPVPPGPV